MYLITGGGSGIGRALAHTLVDKNQSVMIVGRRQGPLEETASYSSLITYISADLSTLEGMDKVVDALADEPRLNGVVHNAALLEPIESISSVSFDNWERAMHTNVAAPLFLTQKLLDKLKQGRVLHLGTGVAYFPVKGLSSYCVSKAALSMLTRCWQLESKEVSFASAMPGICDTHMQALLRDGNDMDAKDVTFFQQLKQRGQLVTPETVAQFLAWLLLKVSKEDYVSKEWDIYDETHHDAWLVPPHKVIQWGA